MAKHYKISRNYKKEMHQKFLKKVIKLYGGQGGTVVKNLPARHREWT